MKLSVQYLIAIFATNIVFMLFVAPQAHAGSFSWLSAQATAQPNDFLPSPYVNPPQDCRLQKVFIGQISLKQQEVCVYQQDGFRLGYLNMWVDTSPYSGYLDHTFVIGFPNESHMYRVDNLSAQFIYIPQSKDLLLYRTANPGSGWNYLSIVRDFASQLKRRVNADLSISYTLPNEALQPVMYNELGAQGIYVRAKVSSNGAWLVYEGIDGFTRVNLATLESKWFSPYTPAQTIGIWGSAEFAISDDGTKIATAGRGVDLRVYELSDNCGSSSVASVDHVPSHECPYVSLWTYAASGVNSDMDYSVFPHFDGAGGELSVYVLPIYRSEKPQQARWMTMTAHGYLPIKLDYLALGDSYSSGEGDTLKDKFGHKYYRNYTDNEEDKSAGQPREKCHISTRSYPYRLAQGMGLTLDAPREWNTVACSAATTNDVKAQGSSTYNGQGNRLKGYDIVDLKTQALNEFIPGRQKQIEFVKKYKPKVITLTMGGNDVGFGDKISSCATSSSTCDFAQLSWRSKLKNELDDQFSNFVSLYQELINASDHQARIYVLGYPQFINETYNAKCRNTYNLDGQERRMIVQSVAYLNNVIEQAAKKSGVKYVNIENSIANHKLCDDGEQHVTAITNIFGANGNERQESFHPNANGHIDIARAFSDYLGNENPLTYSVCDSDVLVICPDESATREIINVPAYFTQEVSQETKKVIYTNLSEDILIKKKSEHIATGQFYFQPGSSVDVTLHSDPVHITTLVAEADGSTSSDIFIPDDIAAGFHTVVLSGKTYSGEDVEYYQIVEVRGSSPSDIDEDGIPDDIDRCAYIAAANQDADQDGVDDACDSEIGRVPLELSGAVNDTSLSNGGNQAFGATYESVNMPENIFHAASLELPLRLPNRQNFTPLGSEEAKAGGVLKLGFSFATAIIYMLGLLVAGAMTIIYLRRR